MVTAEGTGRGLSVARLAIDKDFLDGYSKLHKPVQNSVKMAIDKFAEHVHARLQLEKLNRCMDDRIRTIRVDQFGRGVVLAPDTCDTYFLLRVIPYDLIPRSRGGSGYDCMTQAACRSRATLSWLIGPDTFR
jgi:hypothetical protein